MSLQSISEKIAKLVTIQRELSTYVSALIFRRQETRLIENGKQCCTDFPSVAERNFGGAQIHAVQYRRCIAEHLEATSDQQYSASSILSISNPLRGMYNLHTQARAKEIENSD